MVREGSADYRITDIDESERPRERLAKLGPGALSNAELIAILLRVGVRGENAVQMGTRILNELGGLGGIHKASFEDVCAQRGVGTAKAAQLKAAIELGNRLSKELPDEKPKIQSPSDAVEIVRYEMSALPQEHLRVMTLDTKNHLISIEKVYIGSLNSSIVRVGELFKGAIQKNAASIIVVHNHPSGDPSPSPEDIALTRSIVQAGKLLDIEVLDHLIIGLGKFSSLKDKGLGFG
jgi:DNA repair protein RadC